ncbi:GspE/PulE family protein [Enterovibrio norvegicus]|uniref:GspE/PulE family protein n=1 Tax=Enterovibrio norvegicus TaxID=188144 RepID=UPI000C839F37|nr:ATPase, T2SS/T4P/T4SS family [Enterovibrio norvegicus]PMH64442.1 hypothetical protein BCU62_15420 [Enterovibrio norvegicus]
MSDNRLREEIIAGISSDESLFNIICERGDCYVNDKGQICVASEDTDIEPLVEVLQYSEIAFDGIFYGKTPKKHIVSTLDIKDVILHLKSSSETEEKNNQSDDSEAKQRLQRLLELSLQMSVSDIHIKILKNKNITQISGRIDGEFLPLMQDQYLEYGDSIGHYAAVSIGQKQAFSMNTQVDCTFIIDTQVTEADSEGQSRRYTKPTKWRMSQIPLDDGTKITMRALETGSSQLPELETLGLTKGHVNTFVNLVNAAQGATIMSGPTGSGKTTTINCALATIKPTRLIHSLEDPVEFNREGRNHFSTAVDDDFVDGKNKKTKSFEYYGKVLLRHDTNVLYFGEIRDKVAAAQFMRLSTSGQVMVGTIHTNSSISIITTLAEQLGIPVTQLASPGVLRSLAHQRLVRKLCPNCRISHADAHKYFSTDPTLEDAVESVKKIAEVENRTTETVFYRRIGGSCTACNGSGEKGRTALFEMVLIDEKARSYIRDLRLNEWLEHLKASNWPSIVDHGRAKILNGDLDYRSVIEEVDGLVEEDITKEYEDMHAGAQK